MIFFDGLTSRQLATCHKVIIFLMIHIKAGYHLTVAITALHAAGP